MNYLIAGLAKSGTTMLFSRLQQALGSATSYSFEPDQAEQLNDILYKGKTQDTLTKVLIGRVLPGDDLLHQFDRHVVIYRDPRDQFISMLLYLFYDFQLNSDQTGFDECFDALKNKQQYPAEYSSIKLYELLAKSVGRAPVAVFKNLHRVQKEYVAAFSPFMARYEDLLEGRWGELESYLGLALTEEAQVPDAYKRVVRTKGYGDWRHWLTAEDIEYTNAHWGECIMALGYPLGVAAENQVIDPETSTHYVSQFDPSHSFKLSE